MPEEYTACRDALIEEDYSEEDAKRICAIQYHKRHGEMPQQAEEKKRMKEDEREYLDSIADEITGSMQILKSTEKEFIIYGPASAEIVDGEGDVIKMSAFKQAKPQLIRAGRLMLAHQDTVIGEILEKYQHNGTTYETGVEGDEFMVVGNVWANTQMAKKTRKDIEAGRIRAYSISGTALKEKITEKEGQLVNEIWKIDLHAVTLCERGMNPGARFKIIKKRDSDSVNSTDRRFEELTQRLKTLEEVNNMTDKEGKGVEKDAGKEKEDKDVSLEDILKEVQGLTKRLDTLEKSKEDTEEEKKPEKKPDEKKPEEKQDEEEEEAEDEETASKKKELDAGEVAEEVIRKLKKSGIIASGGPGKPDSGEEGTELRKEDDSPKFENMEDFYNKNSDTWKEMMKTGGGV